MKIKHAFISNSKNLQKNLQRESNNFMKEMFALKFKCKHLQTHTHTHLHPSFAKKKTHMKHPLNFMPSNRGEKIKLNKNKCLPLSIKTAFSVPIPVNQLFNALCKGQ